MGLSSALTRFTRVREAGADATAASARLLLRRQPWIGFNPIGGSGAEPGLRGGDGGTLL